MVPREFLHSITAGGVAGMMIIMGRAWGFSGPCAYLWTTTGYAALPGHALYTEPV